MEQDGTEIRPPAKTWGEPLSIKSVFWLVAVVTSGWYFALRLPGLVSLPIFNDEATHLRQVQLIRRAPLQNAFLSLSDPKPPLPPWLLALGGGLSSDPLLAGRLVSVLLGFLTLLATIGLCFELAQWRKPQSDSHRATLMFVFLAAVFTILCPYIAFNERMALADPPFLLASVAAAWMSLRARRLLDAQLSLARGLLVAALPLGLIMGAALLSRQVVSCMLWVLPFLALLVGKSDGGLRRLRVAGLWLAVSVVIASVIWVPVVLHGIAHDLAAHWPVIKERVVYHSDYSRPLSLPERVVQIKKNIASVFVPTANGQLTITDIRQGLANQVNTGWYWCYLTPPVFLLSLVSLVYLAIRKQGRVALFLVCYLATMVAPFILVGTRFYSRHLLYGVIPLLVALAWMVTDLLLWGGRFIKNERVRIVGGVGAVGLLLLPSARQILLQDCQPSRQTMTLDDRIQHLTGWPAGYASMRAVQYVKNLAKAGPVVVITTEAWGLPHDALWLYLDGYPDVKLYLIDWFGKQPVLNAVGNGQYLLRRNKWLPQPPAPDMVTINPEALVLFAANPYDPPESIEAALHKFDRVIGQPRRFYNNEHAGLSTAGEGVTLYQLQPPIAAATRAAASPQSATQSQRAGVFTFMAGWYKMECSGPDWLCWSDGRGRVSVVSTNDTLAVLSGQILSAKRPNDVDILLNGTKVASLRVDWTKWEFRDFHPIECALKAGENTLEFVSHNPAVTLPPDTRPLAVAVRNLQLKTSSD